MSRIYTVMFTGTLTAAGTDCELFELVPTANKPIRLRGFSIGQTSELGDAAEESIRISIARMTATVTVGSGGSAVTPVPVDSNDAAAGFTARSNDTTLATTSGATTIIEERAWNERATPTEFWWPDERFAPRAQNAEYLVIRNQTTVADDISILMTAWVEEY